MLPGISNKETDPFNDKNEGLGREGTTLSDTRRSWKELRGSAIDEYIKFCSCKTSHDPVNPQEWNPNLNNDETNVRLVDSIKILHQVQL